jgi:hypothetical protein
MEYFSQLSCLSSTQSQQDTSSFLSFDKIIVGADILMQNKMNCTLNVTTVEGQIGLRNIVKVVQVTQFLYLYEFYVSYIIYIKF